MKFLKKSLKKGKYFTFYKKNKYFKFPEENDWKYFCRVSRFEA